MADRDFFEQHKLNCAPGPAFVGRDQLPAEPPARHDVRFIAYYLPQFHRIPENDLWWGQGFTEWSNVTRALPRYQGHYQPRLPADLGFYDLSRIETLRAQAELAALGGVYGFCIHDYWFSGQRLLRRPLDLIRENKDLPIRFCLNWANENWTRRWDGLEQNVLMKQDYSPDNDIGYARFLLSVCSDPRYIRIDGRPLIMVYRPGLLPDAKATFERWREVFLKAGEADPYIVLPLVFNANDPREFGMDAAAGFPPHRLSAVLRDHSPGFRLFDNRYDGKSQSYAEAVALETSSRPADFTYFPGVCPDWDNEARKPGRGFAYHGSSPDLYADWLENAARDRLGRGDESILFINAWNEWAEGAYLEPDRHYGHAYLHQTRKVLDRINAGEAPAKRIAGRDVGSGPHQVPKSPTRFFRKRLVRRVGKAVGLGRAKPS